MFSLARIRKFQICISFDKIKHKFTLLEIRITSQVYLKSEETEKTIKYDLLATCLAIINKFEVKIIAFLMTWDVNLEMA